MRREKACWVLGLSLIVLGCLLGAFQYVRAQQNPYRGNALVMLQPYREAKTWVFDDPQVGLKREPFIAGIPEMLDRLTKSIPDADKGFRLFFSTEPFPGQQIELTWLRTETVGNWYRCEQYQTEGWLCPALNKYFASPPRKLYAKAEPLQ
jgi:hypothetical protein